MPVSPREFDAKSEAEGVGTSSPSIVGRGKPGAYAPGHDKFNSSSGGMEGDPGSEVV